jgi:hypothetical protein
MIQLSNTFGRLGNQMFQMAYIYTQWLEGYIPDYYLQSPEFFNEKAIKQLYGQGIGTPIDMVAIHVRRGDYVNNDFYVDLTQTDYYEESMLLFPDCDFLIFSDDIEWCKKYKLFAGCEFSEGKSEIEDMNLMAACKGIICANSSFSWWAAFIGYAQKIIAPSRNKWYADGIERTVCPNTWVRI